MTEQTDTTIRLEKATVERLRKRGRKGETYESIIRRLLSPKRKEPAKVAENS